MKYFQISPLGRSAWFLSMHRQFEDGSPVDIWAYSAAQEIPQPNEVPLSIRVQGAKSDYNDTAFGAVVVSERLGKFLSEFCRGDIQLIPATIDAQEKWYVMNLVKCCDCIDRTASNVQYYPPDDDERPGQIRGVLKMVVDPVALHGRHIVRPCGWIMAILVSEVFCDEFTRRGFTGAEFLCVGSRSVPPGPEPEQHE